MSAAWIIYFAGVSKGLCSIFFIVALLALFGGICAIIFSIMGDAKAKGYVKIVVPICIVSALIAVAIPNERTIYLMAGAKVTEDIVKSPEAKQIGDKILKVINSKLDEQVKGEK